MVAAVAPAEVSQIHMISKCSQQPPPLPLATGLSGPQSLCRRERGFYELKSFKGNGVGDYALLPSSGGVE